MHLLKKENQLLNNSPLNPPKGDFFTVSKVFKVKIINTIIITPIICCYEYGRCVRNSSLRGGQSPVDFGASMCERGGAL